MRLLSMPAGAALAGVLLLTGCAPAPATPPASTAAPVVAAAARAPSSVSPRVPKVTGLVLAEAGARLAEAGVRVQALAFDAHAVVSAQYPGPGLPLPTDRRVVVWVGVPPPLRPRQAAPPPVAALLDPYQPPAGASAGAPAPSAGVVLSGAASWYGMEFGGRMTACGQIFDPNTPTIAARELPCGTRVRVMTDTAAVELEVTDWGPAEWTGRRFDLSEAAFALLADPADGVIPVRAEVLGT